MNVLLVVPWNQTLGGVASVINNVASRLERDGHKVVYLHPGGTDRREQRTTKAGFLGYELRVRAPFSSSQPLRSPIAFAAHLLPTLRELEAIVREHAIDIVNIHYPMEAFVYFAMLRRRLPIRLVLSIHGADLFPVGRPLGRYPWAIRSLVAAADALVAPSQAFLRDLVAAFPETASKTFCVQNGINIEELQQPSLTLSTAAWQPYLLTIATHNPKKALDVLLHAFARIAGAHPQLRLLLVGDGPLTGELRELARSLSIERRVEFLDVMGRPEVARLMHDCVAFVLPSRSEPFGLVVAEALACRRPVVASAVGGIPEIVEHGKSGLLVPPDDDAALAAALETLLVSETLQANLARAGYERVSERFGRDRMTGQYLEMFAALLAGRPVVPGRTS